MFMDIFNRLTNKIYREFAFRVDGWRLRTLQADLDRTPLVTAKPVIFFNASSRLEGVSLNAGFSSLSALGLRANGAKVIHFVCMQGMTQCMLGCNRLAPQEPPPCIACMAQSRRMYRKDSMIPVSYRRDENLARIIQGKGIIELAAVNYQDIPLGELVLPSLRWSLRRHHLVDDEGTRYIYSQFILSAWNIAVEFEKVLDKYKPGGVVLFNGQTFPEATAKYIASRKGIRVITHEVGLQPFTAFFSDGEATAYPIHIPDDFKLSTAQNAKLEQYLEQRFQGNFTMAGIKFWPKMHALEPEFEEKMKGFETVVSVFTNVVFDTSQAHANTLFDNMFEWLDYLLKVIKEHPETLFVIRAHPDEKRTGKESCESVSDWVERNHLKQLPNVIFVDSNEHISSYDLIQSSKFILIFNSTIGLEAVLLKKPVLAAGKARFTQIPVVEFPTSKDGYIAKVENLLSTRKIAVSETSYENAKKFLFYQLFKTSLPFGEFLTADKLWRGYVRFNQKNLTISHLQNSATIKVIAAGVLRAQPFLLPDD